MMVGVSRRAALRIAVLALAASAPAAAFGQGTSASQSSGSPWELRLYGGGALNRVPGEPTVALPPPGPPITTASPIFPSRRVPSWFFGDGASLLNAASAELQVGSRLAPLDEALAEAAGRAGQGALFGASLSRRLTPRLAAIVAVDLLPGSQRVTDEFLAAVEAARTSFQSTFSSVLATGPLTDIVVSATATPSGRGARDMAATGGLQLTVGSLAGRPAYVMGGLGLMAGIGAGARVDLEGQYRFRITGVAPISETDRVTVRFRRPPGLVAVTGVGLHQPLRGAWRWHLEGRVLWAKAAGEVLLDATPVVTTGAPADFIETLTYPSIQFSNSSITGRRSTLSGDALAGFPAVSRAGLQLRTIVTVGIARRF